MNKDTEFKKFEAFSRFRNDLLDMTYNLREQLYEVDRAMKDFEDWAYEYKIKFQEFRDVFGDKVESLCKDIETFDNEVLYPLEKTIETLFINL